MTADIRIDPKGVQAILKSAAVKTAVEAAAEQVAENVRAMDIGVGDKDGGKHEVPLPVKVTTEETDRAHATVLLAHPAGQAVQAKHGALTKAAAEAGLDVNGG